MDPGITPEQQASPQRAIAVSEFFLKNRHLLGFDSPGRALLTAVKEAVDNALDACEDARFLPEVKIEIEQMRDDVLLMAVEDNGPGIVDAQIGKVFGKLLYGSKFHKLAQSRGYQGIGISAAAMYAGLTTGKPIRVVSRTTGSPIAWEVVLSIDTNHNRPDIHRKRTIDWSVPHGTRVELELEGSHRTGPHSVEAYLAQTAIANPHVTLHLLGPQGVQRSWLRSTDTLPRRAREVKPHPHGVELGRLIAMLRESQKTTLSLFLRDEFSGVGRETARDIIGRSTSGLTERSRPARVAHGQAASLHRAIAHTKIRAPSTDCIVPIGEDVILAGLQKEIAADLYFATTRPPAVYRGNPFVVEVGIAYGKPGAFELNLGGDGQIVRTERPKAGSGRVPEAGEPAQLLRYANRVPLLFQQSACAITRAVAEMSWHGYGLDQPKGALPIAPMVLLVHVASVWVPFTSESKEAIAHYPEISREIRLALQECGRKLRAHVGRNARLRHELDKRSHIERYLPHVGVALQQILGLADTEREAAVERLGAVLQGQRKM